MSDDRCAAYAVRQGLTAPRSAVGFVELARRLCGFQDQVYGTAAKSAEVRSASVNGDDLRRLLQVERRLVRTWTVRGTVHVIAADDLSLFRNALRPEWEGRWSAYLDRHVTHKQRQMAADAARELLTDGPLIRSQMLAGARRLLRTDDDWLEYLFGGWGGVLKDMSYRGDIVCGAIDGGEVQFALTDAWLDGAASGLSGDDQAHSPDDALGRLLVRYLEGYGPATLQDFVYWSGSTMARARQALALAGSAVVTVPAAVPGLLASATSAPPAATGGPGEVPAPVALLPRFDPYSLAHRDKFYLPPEHHKDVFRAAGQVAATVVSGGRIVGTWRPGTPGRRGRAMGPMIDLFSDLAPQTRRRVLAGLRPA